MKIAHILFSCLILSAVPLSIVQAAEEVSTKAAVRESPAPSEPSATEETSAEREAYAQSLFEGRCQMCHQLPEPGMLRPKQWKLILTTMQQRMQQAGVPPLTEDETGRLLAYLGERAR